MSLSANWLSEGTFDSEYKQYVLLAYLQEVRNDFDNKLLYPNILDLYNHYIGSLTFKKNLEEIRERQKRIKGFDMENERIIYEEYTDDITTELHKILNFSIPKFEEMIEFGNDIHKTVKGQIHLEKIGLRALNEEYGLLILKVEELFFVYEYEEEKILKNIGYGKEIKTTFLKKVNSSITNNPDKIKEIFQGEKKHLVNTYLAWSDEPLNVDRTMLPMTKEIISALSRV